MQSGSRWQATVENTPGGARVADVSAAGDCNPKLQPSRRAGACATNRLPYSDSPAASRAVLRSVKSLMAAIFLFLTLTTVQIA